MNLPVFMSFVKRDFCDERKGTMQDQRVNAAVQTEARSRYAAHVQWAYQRERRFHNSKMQRAVKTWLEGAKTLMNVMPDGTFICQYAKKQDLYDQFMLEARDDTSGVLQKCTQACFMKIWSTQYQEIRLCKHCQLCTFESGKDF